MMTTTNLSVLLLAMAVLVSDAFLPASHHHQQHQPRLSPVTLLATGSNSALYTATSNTNTNTNTKSSIVVVSPPGGVGEVTAVKAASLGATVKWFVVSSQNAKVSPSTFTFAPDALRDIQMAGGSVELAGADADALLQERDAVAAVRTWCASTAVDGLVCCMDGSDVVRVDKDNTNVDFTAVWQDAIKVAAREASKSVTGLKLAILAESAADDDTDDNYSDATNKNGNEDTGSSGGLLGGFFGGKDTVAIPKTLTSAIKADSKLRHGTLFGIPESSPSFSVLLGGPQKNPILCDEYQMRNVRLDPSTGSRKDTQSCRHVVGEAAAWMVTNQIPVVPKDVSITSLRGMDKFDLWAEEFARVVEMERKGQGAVLFSSAFSSVPSIERLSSWIATKWAPAVMRTYDIAAIRVGARPVYANTIQPDLVEIVWQELVNFESVTVGRLLIQITNEGITATRGPGDASKGFGSISRKPLNGEAVLIQRLADAASQAIEKGLAKKPAAAAVAKKVPTMAEPKKPEPTIVSSLQSTQTVIPVTDSSGPRLSGAKRSSEKARGKRTRRALSSTTEDDTTTDESGAFE